MTYEASSRLPRAAIGLLTLVVLCFLLQIGALVSQALADAGGGTAATSVQPDIVSDQVAATAAEFRVDESGAATYSIPLYGVPGTAGVAPKLALSYSSQGSYGPLGKGWSISGLSSISRCRATREAGDFIVGGVATDGNPSPINYTSTDQYCLDGQRLLPVANSPACAAAGGLTARQYRTEIESFQRVCAYSGANDVAFFTVQRKDGSTSWYGDRDNNATANRADGYFNSTSPGEETFALSWAQTRFQDSTGNYIDFIYLENPAGAGTGEQLLSEVRYTGKTVLTGQSGAASAPYAKVMFNYSARPTTLWGKGFASGGALTQSRRLDSVTSCATGSAGACALSIQARYYQLTYGTTVSGSGLDILTSLQECRDSSKGVCLPATTFNWSQAKNEFATFEQPAVTLGNWNSPFEGMKYGDVDGDGRQDMVYLLDGSSGGGCPTESVYVGFSRLDSLNRLNLVNNFKRICTPAELMVDRGDGSWKLLDYDGDGRDDLFVSGPAGTGWAVYPSLGDTDPNKIFDNSRNLIANVFIPSSDTPDDQPQLADLNGDGLMDVVYPVWTTGTKVLKARLMARNGATFGWGAERAVVFDMASVGPPADTRCSDPANICDQTFEDTPITNTGFTQLADFNGDGASDLLVREILTVETPPPPGCNANLAASATNCQQIFQSRRLHAMRVTGITATTINMASTFSMPGGYPVMVLGDANGDGLTDLFYRIPAGNDPNNWHYRINTGKGMSAEYSLGAVAYSDQAQFVDINGDGRTDFIFPSGNIFFAKFSQPDGSWSAATSLGSDAFACVGTCDPNKPDVNLFADFDGDGALDHIDIRPGDTPNIFVSRAAAATGQFKPRDVITKIVNGLGAETDIAYAVLTNKDLYQRDSGSRDTTNWGRGAPVQDVLSTSYTVQQVSSSSPGAASGLATVYYRYAGAKAQAGGRGFLGFREITTIDPNQSGGYVTTTTDYNQNFPYIGMPAQTVKRAVIGQVYAPSSCMATPGVDACFSTPGQPAQTWPGNPFSISNQAWESDTDIAGTAITPFVPGTQAPIHVRTSGTQEQLQDTVTGTQTSRVVTTFGYGSYGNAVNTTVDTYTGPSTLTATLITANIYAADNPALWRLGRLSATTVTHRRPNRTDVQRTTSFGYSSVNGLLNQERLQPSLAADQDLMKVYGLDDYGNRTQVTACAAPAAACSNSGLLFHSSGGLKRTSRSAYDSIGRYPIATYELFWDGAGAVEKPTQTVVARNLFGDVTQAYDLNGRDTLAVPGTFGRAYYAWAEATPGSVPGAVAGGVDSFTTYRWCGTGSNQVSCPTGAKFRQKVTADGAPAQWSYFDVLGRPMMKAAETFNVGISGKDVTASCTTYDATGKPKQVSNPFFLAGIGGIDGPTGLSSVCTTGRSWTTTTYDVLGRPLRVVSPDSSSVSNSYSGLTTTSTDPRGNATAQTRNGKGELTQVVDANGLAITYWYQADGSNYLVSRDAGRGAVQNTFFFDALGRKIRQVDQDSGTTAFAYNAFGELTAQQDGDGNRIENEIDARGRVWRKTVKQADGTIESQSTYNFDTAANGVGQLADETITGTYSGWTGQSSLGLDYTRSYSYDSLGRPLGSTTGIDGVSYTAGVQYDGLGRPWKAQDVSGNWIKTEFNPRGMGAAVCFSDAADAVHACASPWQRTQETDAWGHVLGEVRSATGQMPVTRTYDPLTGRAKSICADNSTTGPCNLVDEHYGWDADGNLSTLQKDTRYLETFTYDSLNRLTLGQLSMQDGMPSTTVLDSASYDLLGNICRKATYGVGGSDFTYIGRSGCGLGGANSAYGSGGTGTVGAHQVGGLNGGVFYYYDTRGNQTIKDAPSAIYDRTISYSIDDKAYEASSGTGVRTRFWYGSDGQRYKREDTSPSGTKRTLYLGNVEIVTDAGTTTVKRTIAGVVLQTITGSVTANQYLFHDQLGSVVRITDSAGAVINSQDFDAFGSRRDYSSHTYGGPVPTLTTRGYTGHEMVDGVLGLIHMNGRIFDPGLGRFLQADPVIQSPDNAQSWNAYSYVLNNPYRYTDPTGDMSQSIRQGLAIVVAIVAAYFGQYYISEHMLAAAFAVAVVGGFVSGAIASQSLKGGLMGAFGAALTFGIGVGISGEWAVAAQAVSGGIMESLQGGSFGHGFLAAGLTAGVMPEVSGITNAVERTAVGAIVGGTISEVTGGKFANGAISGAIQGAMAGGDRTQRDMQQDAARSNGEWIYPEGRSTDMNDYDTVMTNGILGDRGDFINRVNQSGNPGYFNPSQGFAGDIMESMGQKFFGGSGDPLAAGFAQGLAGVNHPMTIIAHSQGTLTAANAARYYGLPRGSTFVMRSPALSYFSARSAVSMNGGTLQYVQRWGDVANIYAPTMNPFKWMSGFRDLTCGMCTHSANGLP